MQQGEFYFMAVGSFITVGVLGLGMWLDHLTGERIRTSLKESKLKNRKSNQEKITWYNFDYSNPITYPDSGTVVLIKLKDGNIGIGKINSEHNIGIGTVDANSERIIHFYPWNLPKTKISAWAYLPNNSN